jgi:CPA1 family monovalent cation:H+ antiporter
VVLCLAGVAASALPGLPDLDLPPDLVFLVFLPALLYRSSFLTSPQTCAATRRPSPCCRSGWCSRPPAASRSSRRW